MTKELPNKSSEPPTQDKFAEWVTDGIRKAGATADIIYDPERLASPKPTRTAPCCFWRMPTKSIALFPSRCVPKCFRSGYGLGLWGR